jgi:hypothetical protein
VRQTDRRKGRAFTAEEAMTPAAGESAKASSLFTTVAPSHGTGSVVCWLTGDLVVRVEECLG